MLAQFGQFVQNSEAAKRKSLWRRSKYESTMMKRINLLMCVLRNMSAVGRSGKGSRWNIRQQLAEICKQGWMNDSYELLWEECEVWLTQKKKKRKGTRQKRSNSITFGLEDFSMVSTEEQACCTTLRSQDGIEEEHRELTTSLEVRSLRKE